MTETLQWFFPVREATDPRYLWEVFFLAALFGGVFFACGRFFSKPSGITKADPGGRFYTIPCFLRDNRSLLLFAGLLIVGSVILESLGVAAPVLRLMAGLMVSWIGIGCLSALVLPRFWAETLTAFLCGAIALLVLEIDNHLIEYMDGVVIPVSFGEDRFTLWKLITSALSIAVAMWLGVGLSQLVEKRVEGVDRINASLRALISKIVRVVFIFMALVIGLTSVGVNLGALAVFSGALGLGLGFGLQKIVSNLISGFILLSDHSIKPGDVIELEGSYGWINGLRARYVSVLTRDGTEHLIPNEDLITHRVVNWSYSNEKVRIRAEVGVSYKEDPHRVIEICTEAAQKQTRVLADPPPVCLLTGFGDSSVDFELRFWIQDAHNGVSNLRSAILLEIWDRFKAEGVEIPFPQRDVHIKSAGGEDSSSEAQ